MDAERAIDKAMRIDVAERACPGVGKARHARLLGPLRNAGAIR